MSADLKQKKRKSGDDVPLKVSKRSKTIKSAEQVAPIKSALKKSKVKAAEIAEEVPEAKAMVAETKKKATRSNGKSSESSKKVVKKVDGKATDDAFTNFSSEDEGDAHLSADQTAALIAGFSSDESEDEEAPNKSTDGGIDISSLPSAPTSAIQSQLSTAASDPESTPGVIYLGRVPHGFYEKQMRAYFSQFGTISNLRLARNRRTGASKHYAFVEFASAAVAEIVAKTMDKYLLLGHIMQAKVVHRDQVKENIWIQGKNPGRRTPHNKIERGHLRRGMERNGWEKRVTREEERRRQKEEGLKELGYEFEMPKVKAVEEVEVRGKEDDGKKAIEKTTETVTEVVTEAEGEVVVEEKKVKVTKKRKSTGEEEEVVIKKSKKKVAKK